MARLAEANNPPERQRPLHRRAARRVGRGAHHVLRWVGSFAAIVILVLLFGIWRLMQGPIELNWLTPYVEAAFQRSGIGLTMAISGVRIGIDRSMHQLDLRAENVVVSLPDGQPVARLPEFSTAFGLGALLGGRLEPTQVVIEHPVLHLVRDATGSVTARISSGEQAAADLGPQLLERLAGPPDRNAPLGMLRRVTIRGATVTLDDQRGGRTWRAGRVDIAIERSGKGIRGDVSLSMPLGASMPELHASYRYFADRRVLEIEMAIDGIEPAAIPPVIPELAQLRHIEAPISGTLLTRIDFKTGRAQGSRLDLALGAGRLRSEWLPAGSIAVEKGELHAIYAPETDEIRIESLALDLGGGAALGIVGKLQGVTPELIAAANDARPPGRVKGSFAGTLKQVPVARLGELWPQAFSAGGRRWTLANVHDGVLDEASVQFALDLDPAAHTGTVLNAEGRLQYRDLAITYFKGLPPVRKVGGTATFGNNVIEFVPTAGSLKGMKLTGGSVRLTNLDEPIEWLTIDLGLAGPLQDALEVLDQKPLQYARAIGLDPAQVAGRAETQVRFKLPLLNDLKLETVDYSAKSTIVGAKTGKVVLDRELTDGNFTLDLARTGARLKGTARFDNVPARLDAAVTFNPKGGPHAVYRVGMSLDDEAQRRLGLDFAPERVNGPIALEATYQAMTTNAGEATAVLDLRDASLSIPEAGWKKPPGQPGSAKIVLDLDNDRISRIRNIEVSAPGLDGRLGAQLASDHKQIDRVDIRRLAVGESVVSGTVGRRAGGGWRADIHAARIDARHLMKDATGSAPAPTSPPLAVNARIDRLVMGAHRELQQVNAELLRTAGTWQTGRIDGRFASGHQMSLRFGEPGSRRLFFQSDDFGATLKLLDIADNVVGGHLTIDGQLSETAGKRTLRAHVEGQNYTIARAPGMARLLALPSLTGFASLLSGTGLPFSTLRGDFVYSGSQITIERMLAFGESLGITANGWIDTDRDRLELQGTVAPAYMINSLLGNIPVIGQLLGGGSQGLIAANYQLSGPMSDPAVAVNPLSALAPGILRQLFAPLVGFSASPQESSPALQHPAAAQ